MDLEFFKKEVGKIKQVKQEIEEKERLDYIETYKQVIKNLREFVEKLKPYIEYTTKEFNLDDRHKVIEYSIPYTYNTISIRWIDNFDEAVFSYKGHGSYILFSLSDIINKKIVLDKDKLQWIKDSFCLDNLSYFVDDLLKKLKTNDIIR